MRELTLEEIQKAYEYTKLIPVRRQTYDPVTKCACPIAALYLDAHPGELDLWKYGDQIDYGYLHQWAADLYGGDFIYKFVLYYDEISTLPEGATNHEKKAWKIAQEVAKAFFFSEKETG